MNPSFARFLSVVLHPVFMPSYLIWFLLNHGSYFSAIVPPVQKAALYLIVFVNTLVVPVVLIRYYARTGRIRTVEMESREERILPFTNYLGLLLLSYYLMDRLHLPAIASSMILGAAIAVAVALAATFFWKISIHLMGIGGALGVLFSLSSLLIIDLSMPILLTLLVAGLLGTARLSLGAHQPLQVYAGFAAGFISEFLVMSW